MRGGCFYCTRILVDVSYACTYVDVLGSSMQKGFVLSAVNFT